MMDKENEKNSSIQVGELSDDDLGSVAGGMEQIIMSKGGTIDWKNCSDMEITYKNGKYEFYLPQTKTRFEAIDK